MASFGQHCGGLNHKLPLHNAGFWVLKLAFAAFPALSILPHSKFIYSKEDGLIKVYEKSNLHLNARGGSLQQSDPIVLWPNSAHNHEIFDIADGLIKVVSDANLCLNAEGGAHQGHRLILWGCEKNSVNEEFLMEPDGRIHLQFKMGLCVNVEGGKLVDSANLILWPCHDSPQPHEVFVYHDRMIKVKSNMDLHFNVARAVTEQSSPVVLYSYRPQRHERFEFTNKGQLRVRGDGSQFLASRPMCLNAEGGLTKGHKIVLWPCSDPPTRNELWTLHTSADWSAIIATDAPELGFNIAAGVMEQGAEIVLWDLEDREL